LRKLALLLLLALPLAALATGPEEHPAPGGEFATAWTLLFGTEPAEAALAPSSPEEAFRAAWEAASPALPAAERPAARDALRLAVLGDAAPVRAALRRTVAAGRLLPADSEALLWYAFLLEAGDPAALPEALPPGPGGQRALAATSARGGDPRTLLTRFAAWVASRAAEEGLLDGDAAGLPAVWLLDADLAPGAFTAWRLRVPEWAPAVRGESAGAGSLRLFSLFADASGAPVSEGAGLADRSLLLPRRADTLWLVLWNPPWGEADGSGATLTLWGDLAPPFQVREARLASGACDLLLSESPGMAAYRLWGRERDGASAPLAPAFPSEGPGLHRYRIPVDSPPAGGARLELRGLTWAGGTASADLARPEPPAP